MGPVLGVVNRAISRLLISIAGLTRREAKTGAVTLIQRFGSAAGNLNIHFRSLVIYGIYRLRGSQPVFEYVAAPTNEGMARPVEHIAKRVMKLLARRGYLIEEEGVVYFEAGRAMRRLSLCRQRRAAITLPWDRGAARRCGQLIRRRRRLTSHRRYMRAIW